MGVVGRGRGWGIGVCGRGLPALQETLATGSVLGHAADPKPSKTGRSHLNPPATKLKPNTCGMVAGVGGGGVRGHTLQVVAAAAPLPHLLQSPPPLPRSPPPCQPARARAGGRAMSMIDRMDPSSDVDTTW